MKILIVDDDVNILKSFEIGLDDCNYELHLFSNPIEALEEVKHSDFDIVISDINMPQMNGIELLKEIKKINSSLRIILITAFGDFRNTINAIRNDVHSFFLKPIDIKEVILTIEDIKQYIEIEDKIK